MPTAVLVSYVSIVIKLDLERAIVCLLLQMLDENLVHAHRCQALSIGAWVRDMAGDASRHKDMTSH